MLEQRIQQQFFESADLQNQAAASLARPVAAAWDGAATLTFATPEFGVAPGQAAVLYRDTRLIGGGRIAATVGANALHRQNSGTLSTV